MDWDRIDLSEWLAILEATGQLPDGKAMDLESLTGSGSKLDVTGERLNTVERLEKRLETFDVDQYRNKAYETMEVDTGNRGNVKNQ